MLNLNVQIGSNPLQKHKPIYFKTYQELPIPYSYTIGQAGEIVAWKKSLNEDIQQGAQNIQNSNPNYVPVYYMIPSINGDHEKCLSFIITQLRLINQEQKTYKIVTYHADNRLRIWQARDGTCINISSHNFISEKVIGLCENTTSQTRFIFAFSQNSIFIIDCWTMTVLDKIEPKKQVYSQFLKGRINENKQLELYDNYHKSYKFDVSKLIKESFIDVGRTINSLDKVMKELVQITDSLHQEKLVLIHKIWKTDDYKTSLNAIMESQKRLLEKFTVLSNLFDESFIKETPEIEDIFSSIEIAIENLLFIKGAHLWYFIGTEDGKIYGFPAVRQKRNEYFIVKDESSCVLGSKNPVKFLSLIENLLICSWQNGNFKVYTTDNFMYMIEQQTSNHKSVKSPTERYFHTISMNNLCISRQKFSSPIKHPLPIFSLPRISSINASRVGNQQIAFQLQNNEIILFDALHHDILHFVGIEEGKKVYVVMYMTGSNEYVGVGTQDGVEVFGPEGYERVISYKDWQWRQWSMVSKYSCNSDPNSFHPTHPKGLQLLQFSNRHSITHLQYTTSTTRLLQQTFGQLNTQTFDNQLYAKFYFIDKDETERTVHSRAMENYIAVVKCKLNALRKEGWGNTMYVVNCGLGKELEGYSGSVGSLNGKHVGLQAAMSANFVFYSCFLWDIISLPFLTPTIQSLDKTFILNRRYAQQGIAKDLTIYFNNQQSIFNLSKYLLTQYAMATISFMQCYVLKEIERADDLVEVVEYFTLNATNNNDVYVSGQVLAKSITSHNQNIVKACINLLISTIIAGHVNLHPLYQYFVLNLKNLQQEKQAAQSTIAVQSSASKSSPSAISSIFPSSTKNNTQTHKELSEVQCEWMLYLGLGLIYGKGIVQKQQIKMLISRIIACIELTNFITKPDLVQVILKILNEGLGKTWKQLLTKDTVIKLYLDLFKIFFLYDGIGSIPPEDKKFNFCFENNTPQQIKKMKQSIMKSIVVLSKQFNNEFIQCITTESVNQKIHHAYPASVIEILRQYLKTEKPTAYLVFYIQLLLQCLSPMTPNLRKYVQKNVISTLQLMCTYKSVSFNQSSQRLSIKSNNHLYIYCLRTSTKWRTISLLKQEGKQEIEGVRDEDCVLEMSPKGSYIGLLTYKKLYVWRLSSGFWSGLLGSLSQREAFDIPAGGKGINIVWDNNESSVTVVNEDPSLNKAFRV